MTERIAILLALAISIPVFTGCSAPPPLNEVRAEADEDLRRGRVDEALEGYQSYVDRKPTDHEVQFKLANTLARVGELEEARGHYKIAVDLQQTNEDYIRAYADALFQLDERDDLLAFLRRLTSDRGSVDDYLLLGYYAAKMGDPDTAEDALLTAARLDRGTSLEVQMALADFYASIGDKQRAVERYRMALSFDLANQDVLGALRELGVIPGPSLQLRPLEAPAQTPARANVPAEDG